MNKQASLTKTSEKNGNDSLSEKSNENLSQSISPTGQILQMQQTIGNQAVQELFKSGAIQAKLKTGQPGNQYEQEADQAADCIAQNRDCRENPLSPVEPQIQRAPANENQTPPPPPPPPTTQTETTKKTAKPLPGLIVEDTVKVLADGQMKKKQFLDQLEVAVCSTVNSILEGTEYSTDSCPYIQFYLLFYRTKSSQHIERALLRYAPESAGAKTAKDYINFIIARAAMATVIWLDTGEVTGIPKGFAAAAPGEGSEGEGSTAGVAAKARAGGLRNADNVQAIQSRLGPGQPLDGGVKSRIGSAFARDFSHVRIHTDATAAQLSDHLNARAFTIGKDIAFSRGEYRPGTLVGDALIAHELAHTIQQQGGGASAAPMQKGYTQNNALEEDADMSAVSVVASTWGGIKAGFTGIAKNALPRLRSGLRLQRCGKKKSEKQKEKQKESESERIKREIASVKSLHVELLKKEIAGAGREMLKAFYDRQAKIRKALNKVKNSKYRNTNWARRNIRSYERDLSKTLLQVISTDDSRIVIASLRNKVVEKYNELLKKEKLLKPAEKKWHRYDMVFASDEVVKTLKKEKFSPAELKAMIGQESGDLTLKDTKGKIVGIAQLSEDAAREVNCKLEDRLDPEKAIPCASKYLIKGAENLRKFLKNRNLPIPTGAEFKKFAFACYNAGATKIANIAKKAHEMGRDSTKWDQLIEGGKESPLYLVLKQTLKGKKLEKKYREIYNYNKDISRRLPK